MEKGYRPHAPWHDRRPLPIWEVRPMSAAEPTVARRLYGLRREAERRFGNLVSLGGGLSPLPAWVRRLSRVRLWVGGTLFINAVRIRHLLERADE